MAAILYTIVGMAASASLHCAVRREISPCTCTPGMSNTIQVTCEGMDSFHDVIEALNGRFNPDLDIKLTISFSKLLDMENRTFSEMNMNVKHLRMNFDNFGKLSESTFRNMSRIEYLSLADSNIKAIPPGLLRNMPNIDTLDLARTMVRELKTNDLKSLRSLKHLVMAINDLESIEPGAFPPSLSSLHIGRNQLTSLNGTIRDLVNLKMLFINSNNLTTLENELPQGSDNLFMLMAMDNLLDTLPESLKTFPNLDTIFLDENRLTTLNKTFAQSKRLRSLYASRNMIEYLATDEFEEALNIDELHLQLNQLKSLNGSIAPLKKLRMANFSHNQITEFSMSEIFGLTKLKKLELSHNKITRLLGIGDNLATLHKSSLGELRLENNLLESLDGHLMGLNKLAILNLAHNRLKVLLPNDLQGMEELEHLDLSFNQLVTIQDVSKAYLPTLEILNASYNMITELTNEFQGLPVLCMVDMSNNKIDHISTGLVSNTRCRNHGVAHNKLEILLQENPILCNESVSDLVSAMELQQARIRGVAHCIIPQEFTIKKPIIPMQPLQQQLLPVVVVGQSPAMQMSGAPAVVQVLVPSNQIIPNQIPVLVPSNIPQTTTAATPISERVSITTQAPPVVAVEAQTISSYILSSTTKLTTVTQPTTPTPTSTTPIPIIAEEITDVDFLPEEIPLEPEPVIELGSPKENEPTIVGPEVSAQIPISSRMHYSADPPTDDDDELQSNGILEVAQTIPEPFPEIIMPPVAESSHRKLVQPEDDPPEMLHDQEMPPTLSEEVVEKHVQMQEEDDVAVNV